MISPPLYLTPAVRKGLGPYLRPGGPSLTRRILELTTPRRDAKIVDAGCGTGAGMQLLRQYGVCSLIGVDCNPDLLCETRGLGFEVIQGDLAALPFAKESLDQVICECAWNLGDRKGALAEFARVLRPGGLLALADIFLKNPQQLHWPVASCFRAAGSLPSVIAQVTEAGFRVSRTEDHSRLLTETAAAFVFAHGSLSAFWRSVTGCKESAEQMCRASASSRPGLFLLIGERNHG